MSIKNTVIYIPYALRGGKTNDYTFNMVKILKKNYNVMGELTDPTDIFSMIKTKAVILNWVEKELNITMKFQLCLYQIFGARIIWVFHNKMPHDFSVEDGDVKGNMKWLADKADYIILHSKSSEKYISNYNVNRRKKVYIPHVMYKKRISQMYMDEVQKSYGLKKEDFVFVMFGFLKPYKHYEDGIMAFRKSGLKNAKLILAGSCTNAEYARYLKNLAGDCKDIILDIRYIPELILDSIIAISDVVVLPYVNDSSMNSGVMIQAFSNGKPVISPGICMARDYAPHGFVYGYKRDLCTAMRKAHKNGKEVNARMGRRAFEYINRHNNETVVEKKLVYLLENG